MWNEADDTDYKTKNIGNTQLLYTFQCQNFILPISVFLAANLMAGLKNIRGACGN
jgi:hypothetical protein